MFFLELSCFFRDPVDVGNLISGSSAFSKTSLNIRKFTVHVLLKPGLENFEHYFTSTWDECNCAVVWAFFGIAFLWDWNENWPFPILWPLLSFPNLLAHWVQHFYSIISHASKVMLKILQARLQQYVNRELPDVQTGFRKGRGTRDCQHPLDHRKSKRVPEKTSISALLTKPKPLTVWITINCGKFWKRWEYQTTWSASWETYMQVRKQQLKLDMEQQTGSK